MHFETKIDTLGHDFTIDVDYLSYSNDSKRQNISSVNGSGIDDILNSISSQKIRAFTSQFDLDLPINLVDISIGAKLSILTNHSMNDIFNRNVNGNLISISSDIFNYREITQSAYINLNKRFGKIELQGGIRWEATQTKGTSVLLDQINKNKYVKIFPTLFMTYDHNEKIIILLAMAVGLVGPIIKGLIHSDGIPILIPIQKAIHFCFQVIRTI